MCDIASKEIRTWTIPCCLKTKSSLLYKLLRTAEASQKIFQGARLLKTKQCFNYVTEGGGIRWIITPSSCSLRQKRLWLIEPWGLGSGLRGLVCGQWGCRAKMRCWQVLRHRRLPHWRGAELNGLILLSPEEKTPLCFRNYKEIITWRRLAGSHAWGISPSPGVCWHKTNRGTLTGHVFFLICIDIAGVGRSRVAGTERKFILTSELKFWCICARYIYELYKTKFNEEVMSDHTKYPPAKLL
jgi:hypothetical protein